MGVVREKVAVGQVGGPTAVINSSLFGFLEESLPIYEVYGILNGLQGLAQDRMVPLKESLVADTSRVCAMPGAWLGAGRWPAQTDDFEKYVANLKSRNIHYLALIGGNGTMWTCLQLEDAAERLDYELSVVGIPKTVDNDLEEMDHAPGFGSAARFVAASVRDSGKDLEAMRNFEAVRILETMGRNVGWLALSGGYLKRKQKDPPHLVYVPERGFDKKQFLDAVKETHEAFGYTLVVVSEGLLSGVAGDHLQDPVLGGVSQELARWVKDELGLATRGELLGMGQRSFSLAVSRQDRDEAWELGKAAAKALYSSGGFTLAVQRTSSYPHDYRIERVPFERVAGKERSLPSEWLLEPEAIHEEFQRWLAPLIGEDLKPYPDSLQEK